MRSTLHHNAAPTTQTRLVTMGIAPIKIASSVNLITAQRLAPSLCSCTRSTELPTEALLEAGFTEKDLDGSRTPYAPVGPAAVLFASTRATQKAGRRGSEHGRP